VSAIPKELACRKCKALTSGKVCPICNSTDLSSRWSGLIIVLEPEKSKVAKILNFKAKGRYAIEVN
jgi:DNA-directed RNA polymerase subunit E"